MSQVESIKAAIPLNASASQYAVRNAWEKFVSTGELNHKRLRPVIADSWLRCHELGINPLGTRARSVISKEEIEAKLHTENFGISGVNVFNRMSNTVEDTGHALVLADHTGCILYSVFHKHIQDHLERVNFRPGGEWHTDAVGPNGIGTTLSVGKPEVVMGTEHYCQGWKPWVCYGAPIHNPSDHSVLGVVDITGPANKICVEAMALAISIAHSIESDLSVLQLTKRDKLRQAYRSLQIRWPNDASIAVDEYGFVIDMNSHADTLLNTPSCILNQSIHLYLPSLTLSINTCITNGVEMECEVELDKMLMNSARFQLTPIIENGERLGCFIMILGGEKIHHDLTSLRSNEDELIRKTLVETSGNISKAARILNIDRATIYRRRKNWG
ncbi:MAG: transcriptional regulator of acetoin/glycerol metabolism [Gammaproteobacteria bacterium]|jgi:transcriptional regulator of acetoin/glycerol metabolism